MQNNQLQQFFFTGFVFWMCKLSFLNTGVFVYFFGADFDLFSISTIKKELHVTMSLKASSMFDPSIALV